MERGCVGDQPQHVNDSESLEKSKALRLVEDDTAALRYFSDRALRRNKILEANVPREFA